MRPLGKKQNRKNNSLFKLWKFLFSPSPWPKTVRWGTFSILVVILIWNYIEPAHLKHKLELVSRDLGKYISKKTGLVVVNVLVNGRKYTVASNLLKAANIKDGDPIFGLQLNKIQTQIATLPWVKTARVERQLPDTIFIKLKERQPNALWQRNRRLSLVDTEGEIIPVNKLTDFEDLPIVIGENAPAKANKILIILKKELNLYRRITGITLVADRRWDIRLDDNIDVKLPEQNIQKAWEHLAEIQEGHNVLHSDVVAVDMRIEDKLIIRLTPNKATSIRGKGRST